MLPPSLALNLSQHQGLWVSLYKGEIWTRTVKREDHGKTGEEGCLKASEETNPADILIFQPSVEVWKKYIAVV